MGGAAGHMKHPFEVPGVDTGPQMLQFIEKTRDYLLAGGLADTKIDGTNVSFKLVDTEDGGKEFAVDRGSSQPSDVLGITARNVRNKFGEGHGMIRAIEVLLEIFNEALPSLEPELKALGVWDDPTKIFNTEYVEKVEGREATNVVAYDHNFFKIHGINQFFAKPAQPWRIRKGIGMDRPGLKERPVDKETGKVFDGPSIGVDYDKGAMESLKEKLSPIAAEKDFIVYTLIPVIKKSGVESVDFADSLNRQISITTSRGNIETKSLKEWLNGVINPWQQYVNLVNGRSIPARGKEVYKAILGARAGTEELDIEAQVPLSEMFGEDEEAKKLALDGAVIWHVTRLLGNDIIDAFTTEDMGDMDRHEGIVAKMPEYKFDVKITGEFILGGEASTFRKETAAEEPEKTGNIIALFPGGFKPPHAGHFELAKRYAEDPQISKVLMLIGPSVRRSENGAITITKESSVHIISQFYKQYLGDKVILEDSPGGEENPMRAAFRWIDEIAQPGETYTLAASSKDPKRAEMFAASHKCPDGRYCKEGVEVVLHPVDIQAAVYTGRTDDLNGKPISASVMREDLAAGDKRNFVTNLPAAVGDYVDEIFDFLGGQVKKTPEEPDLPPSSLAEALLVLKEEIQKEKLEEEDLEEVSTMAGGDVEGHALNTFVGVDMEKENENEKRRSHKLKKIAEIYSKLETNYQYISEEGKKDMKINELLKEKKKIEEMALRRYIRSAIRKKTTDHATKFEEERKLRLAIRQMIQEAKIEDSPTKSTGINKLVSVLKVILPTIEKAYKNLTTDKAQRESFVKHLVHAYVNTLSPQKAMRTAYESDDVAMAEGLLKEQEFAADPSKFIDVGIRTEEEEEAENTASAAEKEVEKKVAKEEEAENKKKEAEAIEDLTGDSHAFPEFPGLDLTGRDEAVDVYKKTIDAITRGFSSLHNDSDEAHFEDYLVTNVLLYTDNFEDDVSGNLADITTPERDAARAEKEKFTGGGEMPPPEEEMPPPEEEIEAAEETLEEAIKTSIYSAITKVINV